MDGGSGAEPQRAGDANGFLLYLINELVMIISFAQLPCVSAIKHSAHVELWGRAGTCDFQDGAAEILRKEKA